jgi:hypothetical protein
MRVKKSIKVLIVWIRIFNGSISARTKDVARVSAECATELVAESVQRVGRLDFVRSETTGSQKR